MKFFFRKVNSKTTKIMKKLPNMQRVDDISDYIVYPDPEI